MAHSIVRTLLASGAAAGLMASAGACSCSIGSSSHSVSKGDVAGQITSKMTDAAGNKPDSVTCPGDLPAKVGAQLNCEMKVKNQVFNVNVTVTSVNGNDVKFDMVEMVDKNQVASVISDKLTQQVGKKPDSVTCPDNLKASRARRYGVNSPTVVRSTAYRWPSPASTPATSTSISRSMTTPNNLRRRRRGVSGVLVGRLFAFDVG